MESDPRYSHYYRKPRNGTKIALFTTGALAASMALAYYLWWPQHTFPSPVAALLRKGLWAESNKMDYDFQSALKHYIEALAKADEMDMDKISDEYTGIQLKIAEMFERLNMIDDAVKVYQEISMAYILALTNNEVALNTRPHVIQKDLRVLIKLAQFMMNSPQLLKNQLMLHCQIAQAEVARKVGDLDQFAAQEAHLTRNEEGKLVIESEVKENPVEAYQVMAWQPFRDELFTARDLYTTVLLMLGDVRSALETKRATAQWMVVAGMPVGDLCMSNYDVGSMMYLSAEQFEAAEMKAKKLLEDNPDDKKLEENLKGYTLLRKTAMEGAEVVFSLSLQAPKRLTPEILRDEKVGEAIALSTYGMGVVKLHTGKLDEAEQLLKEAIIRGKGMKYNELVENAENELKKLHDERGRDVTSGQLSWEK